MILVDDARWEWRDERWAHLVSDHSYDELHRFAGRLGLRRLSFQGDHYDVPAPLRDAAIALGAHPVTGRELVVRLRAAGLRRRGGGRPWTRLWWREPPGRFDAAAAAAALQALRAVAPPLADRLGEPLRRIAALDAELCRLGAHALARPGAAAVALDLRGPAPTALGEILSVGYLTVREEDHTIEIVAEER